MLIVKICKRIYKKFFRKSFFKRVADIDPTSKLLNSFDIKFYTRRDNRKYVLIGEHGLLNVKIIFETESGNVNIGNNVHAGFTTIICRDSIVIGNDVTIAWDVVLYDHDSHSIFWDKRKYDNINCYRSFNSNLGNNLFYKDWSSVKSKPIVIKDKVWIGFGVTILKGVTVGEGAVIAAKSVVTKDVPAWTVVAGNPAKVVKTIC